MERLISRNREVSSPKNNLFLTLWPDLVMVGGGGLLDKEGIVLCAEVACQKRYGEVKCQVEAVAR